MINRGDQHSYPVWPGDNRLEFAYQATSGAILKSITIDGKGPHRHWCERGHPVYTTDLELLRGSERTVVLRLVEPSNSARL